MRKDFVTTLTELADRDERVVLLTADLGFSVIEPFAEKHPDRFFNCGVAEQNMIGMATGLAESGLIPFAYSITPFLTLRPYEFIRNGPVSHRSQVRLVGIGSGFDYSVNGSTHFALEDLAVLRAQPGLSLIIPGSSKQASLALETLYAEPGPQYFRLCKEDLKLPDEPKTFRPESLIELVEGSDLAIITCGSSSRAAIEAASTLQNQGVSASVSVVSALNPAPVEALLELLSSTRAAVTVEPHYVVGGLGSAVCEIAAEAGLGIPVKRVGVSTLPKTPLGSRTFLEKYWGIDAAAVSRAAESILQ